MVLQEIRQYDDDFKVWHSAYTNMSSFAHWHEEVELTWVHSGSVVITAEGQQHLATEGDLILCGNGCVHSCDAKGMKNQLEFILFDQALVQSRLSPLNVSFLHITKSQLDEMNMTDEVTQFFEELPRELQNRSIYYREIVRGMLRVFWYKSQRLFAEAHTDTRREGDEQPVKQVLRYLETHYAEQVSLADVAKQANVSECYLSRTFKRHTGMNFVVYRNLLRLEKAVSLLQETTMTVGAIAFNCGFQDIRTFNRVFQQYTGHTPSDFRLDPQLGFQASLHPYREARDQLQVEGHSPVVSQAL